MIKLLIRQKHFLFGLFLIPFICSFHVKKSQNNVLIGKERHDVERPNEWGYPIRGIVKGAFLYLKNFEPSCWPVGNPETGYLNTDGSPTKTVILNQNRSNPGKNRYWNWDFGKRTHQEFYNIKKDPECLKNLINETGYKKKIVALRNQLFAELKQQEDPRMFGNGSVFEKYPPFEGKDFYKQFMEGKNKKPDGLIQTILKPIQGLLTSIE